MGGLFAGINTGLSALTAFNKALQVSQNNVSNASTPGYAKQVATLEAQPFQISAGLPGGVAAGDPLSTRNQYLELAVQLQNSLQGDYSAQTSSLASIESIFSVSGDTGISGALSDLFQSFSAWSASPDSAAARQDVLAKAQNLADSFQQASASLDSATTSLNGTIDSTVQQINTLSTQIAGYNASIQKGGPVDAGLDARVHDALETLSGVTGISSRVESDGTVTVLLGGQTPLVIGNQSFALQTSYVDTAVPVNANAPPSAHILDAHGQDVTNTVLHGSLGGLLQVRNSVLPSLQGDGQQTGSLNQLAKKVADSVNTLLQSGTTSAGVSGVPLFTYNAASNADVSATLKLNSSATAASLAPVDPGPPSAANGIALALANLGNSTNPANQINGNSILDFYSGIASQVGQQSASATNGQDVSAQALAQARSFRATASGVSLDEEAVHLTELQRGYQAASKLISVMDSLVQTLIDMMPA